MKQRKQKVCSEGIMKKLQQKTADCSVIEISLGLLFSEMTKGYSTIELKQFLLINQNTYPCGVGHVGGGDQ